MPDIAMCANGEACSKKESCYRFKATPNIYWQSYSYFYKEDVECEHYSEVRENGVR